MIRAALLFLVVMALIGLLGKYRSKPVAKRNAEPAIESARKCPRCGTYLIGGASCDCDTKPHEP
jgi:hypothetical protein